MSTQEVEALLNIKVRRERLSSLPFFFFEANVDEEEARRGENAEMRRQLAHLQSTACGSSLATLSIGIDNQYQSITTPILAIDWSSIININRVTDIDWYRLISIVIDYRLDTSWPLCALF